MKYIILQGDGMADHPIDALGGKTPLEAAATPNMDWLAARGKFGLTRTIPDGFPPGSDVGNMSILGYDPAIYHTGRAPLEAASMGIVLGADDVAFRCNLVTLGTLGKAGVMEDFAAGHISSAEASEMIWDLNAQLGRDGVEFYPGVSYRHLMVWRGGKWNMTTTPPHDITGREIETHLARGDGATFLLDLMERSKEVLGRHPVNRLRGERGEKKATSIWLWGQGKAAAIPSIKERFGIDGAIVSAVDLVNGIGVYAGLERISVPGATGFLDTNFKGKGEYALEALNRKDLVFVHVEAPDEAGHMGDAAEKQKAIENFDEKVVGTILHGLRGRQDWRLLLLPDHATPVALKTHVADPVPFVLYSSDYGQDSRAFGFNESDARRSGVTVEKAHALIKMLFNRR